MIFIVDVNVVISALIRDSTSRGLLTASPFTFYSPDTLLGSIEKYKDEIIEKSGLSAGDFETLLDFILGKITIIRKHKYELKLEQANNIMGNIDIEDVPFIALALSIENNGIWTDDSDFERQNTIKIWKTEDILKSLMWSIKNKNNIEIFLNFILF